jgi:hypothetical protein
MNSTVQAPPKTLVIACGALARELLDAIRLNHWTHMDVTCLPAIWHNRPEKIPEGVRAKIRKNRANYDHILCLYGDCGTGGLLDRVLEEEGVERIDGPHCYAFYMGEPQFDAAMDEEIGTFFLTDYLVRHFDRLIIQGLGLDRYPQLIEQKAAKAAERLGLSLVIRQTGISGIETFLAAHADAGADLSSGGRTHG